MKNNLLAFGLLSLLVLTAFIPVEENHDCEELEATIKKQNEVLKALEEAGGIDAFRQAKAEIWKLRSEIRTLKKENEELKAGKQ
ncbi:MAG: hypothetical protein ACKOXB_13875 [Flavobacteriales bacterium]